MNKYKFFLAALAVLVSIGCRQKNELNSVEISLKDGEYRIILPEKKGYEIDTSKFDYKIDFDGNIRWVIIKNDYHSLNCKIIYDCKRNDTTGKKLDIYNSFLFGNKPNRGLFALLDKEIVSNRDFDFYTSSFVSFPSLKHGMVDYSQRDLHVSSNYLFNNINFSFTYNKNENSKSYWEILEDIDFIKKIRIVKL